MKPDNHSEKDHVGSERKNAIQNFAAQLDGKKIKGGDIENWLNHPSPDWNCIYVHYIDEKNEPAEIIFDSRFSTTGVGRHYSITDLLSRLPRANIFLSPQFEIYLKSWHYSKFKDSDYVSPVQQEQSKTIGFFRKVFEWALYGPQAPDTKNPYKSPPLD